jgi:hypothetical protein
MVSQQKEQPDNLCLDIMTPSYSKLKTHILHSVEIHQLLLLWRLMIQTLLRNKLAYSSNGIQERKTIIC